MNKYAVLDIDGTLIRWQLFHAIFDEMIAIKSIDKNITKQLNKIKQQWQKRQNTNSYDIYEQELLIISQKILPLINSQEFKTICLKVFDNYKDQVHSLIRDFIKEIKKKNYYLFFISGSPVEIVQLMANYYECQDYAGSVLNYQNNHIKNFAKVMVGQEKLNTLKKFIQKYNLTNQDSYAIGDTLGDKNILQFVEHPIAFNPNYQLYQLALKNHWTIMLERKNVQYQLNFINNHYELAKTINF